MVSHRSMAVLLVGAVVVAACSSDPEPSASADADSFIAEVGEWPAAAASIAEGEAYQNARWSYLVEPRDGAGEVTLARDADVITPMGSNTKLFSVGTWVDTVGTDRRQTTPVHQLGDDLVLVASGDLALGGRRAGTGELAYNVPPQTDANGIPGAEPAPGDPLAGLDDLATQVAAAGVTDVGQVTVDDRLFEPWFVHDEVVSPMVVNDNIIDVRVSPGEVGEPGTIETIPDTEAFSIVNRAQTVEAGGDTALGLVPARETPEGDPIGRTLLVEGTVAADSDPVLLVTPVNDPASYGRTLFVEALERAGVPVRAEAAADNDTAGLPASFSTDTEVAAIESTTAEATATMIWKISHNLGANLSVCLLAVDMGSTDCTDGFAPIREAMADLDIGPSDVWFVDGAGASIASTTPTAIVTWIRWLRDRTWGDRLADMLPILGIDGSLGLTQQDTSSTGKVEGKSGTWAGIDVSTGQLPTPVQAVAGLMQAPGGEEYVFALYQQGATFPTPEGIITGTNDVNDVAAAIQQSLP